MSSVTRGVYPVPIKDPYADELVQPFWDNALQAKLSAAKCQHCGTCHLPPQPYCFSCLCREYEWIELPGTGTIYTFTVIRHPLRPQLADAVPYVSAIIELDGTQGAGARLQANIIDCDPDKIRIGDKVEVVFERVSDTLAVPRFRPM
jgi:uncharacterized protein